MAKRQSVNGSRARHENPIPNASRIGNIVMSSVIGGTNPGTRELPPTLEQQVANVFGYIRHDIEAAGGTVDDIIKITFWVKDPGEAARGAERRVGEDVPRSGCAAGTAHAAAAGRQPRAGAGRLRRRDRLSCGWTTFRTPTATMKFGVGQPIRRLEDLRLLTGKGRYQDDQTLHRQTWCVFVRSPHAHARIRSIDTAAASRAPGVVAVFTGTDYANDGIAMPKAAMPRKKRDGSPMFAPQRPALVVDRARYVGDPVAMVIAETLAQAKDAAELVVVDYDPLPSVTSVAEAAEPDAPRVWDENPDNISHTTERGNRAATEAAFAQAAHIVRRRYVITRVHAQYMEPRGAIGTFDPAEDRYTLYRRRELSAPRAQHARQHGVQGAGEQRARGVPRRGRRLRRQGLAVCRAPADAVGGAQDRTAGEVAVRALRGDPRRRARARQCRHDRAGVRRECEDHRAAAAHAGEHRRLYRVRSAVADAVRPDRHGGRHVRHPGRLRHDRRGAVQYQSRPRRIAAPAGRRRAI